SAAALPAAVVGRIVRRSGRRWRRRRRLPTVGRVVVGVLVTDEALLPLRLHAVHGAGRRQVGKGGEPRLPALDPVLALRRRPLRLVERADGDVDPGAVQVAEGERRATGGTEIARRLRRAEEAGRSS